MARVILGASSSSWRGLSAFTGVLAVGVITLFFGFHTFVGDRGLVARQALDRQIIMAREELALLQKENAVLSHRIALMRSDQVDSDILAETARAELGLYNEDDVIISIDISKLKF